MNLNFLLILLIVSSNFFLSSLYGNDVQNKQIDSLEHLLDTSPKKDTAYVSILIKLAIKLRSVDFERSTNYSQQAIEISERLRATEKLVKAHNTMGITYGMHDKYPEAISHFNQALQTALAEGHTKDAAISYGSLGIVYKRMGEYPTSLNNYIKGNQLSDSVGDYESVASNNQNLGVLFDLMLEPEKAREYYMKAWDWYESNSKVEYIPSLKVNIALLHLAAKEYNQAVEMLLEVIDYYKKNNVVYPLITARSNLGNALFKMGAFVEAEEPLLLALMGAEQHNLIQIKGSILYNLAKSKTGQGYVLEGLALAERMKNVADSTNSLKSKADAQELLSFVHEKAGNLNKALEHYKNFTLINDQIFNETKSRNYKNQQVLMEVYEKDKQLETQQLRLVFLNQEIALEKRWKWTLGVASFFLLLAGGTYYQKYKQRIEYLQALEAKNTLITQQKLEIEEINLQLEKRMLRAQMNPHFIFNALSSIQHFITTNDRASALHYLSHFSNMLRQVLETSVNVNMALQDEIELIKIYLELESLRFEDDFVYEINIDPVLDTEMLEIPTMIIQPFVENAILHGLMPKKGDRKLIIDICDSAGSIACTITDNGIGREAAEIMNKNKTGKSLSRGISVTRQRLELLARNYGLKTEIQYNDLKDASGKACGTQVVIDIPKQEI